MLPSGDNARSCSRPRHCDRCRGTGAYRVSRGGTAATRLGSALAIVPSREGQAVWMLRRARGGGCVIDELRLDGQASGRGWRVDCHTEPVAELRAGLLTTHTGQLGMNAYCALLGFDGRITTFRDPYAQAVTGNWVITGSDGHTSLVLHDMAGGASTRLRWPALPRYGLGEATGQPNGTLATVDFARYSPQHRFDLQLLDTRSGRWKRLPDMPARARAAPRGDLLAPLDPAHDRGHARCADDRRDQAGPGHRDAGGTIWTNARRNRRRQP